VKRHPLAIALLALAAATTHADVKLPAVLSSKMVLQRNQALPFWGWADAGEQVTVSLGGNRATTKADDQGKWLLSLRPMKAGGPYEVIVKGKNTLLLTDVLIGEVWVCSGQSNMQWPVSRSNDPDLESLSAHYKNLRLFYVPRVPATEPQHDTKANWTPTTPDTVKDFSAVGYFFARQLHQTLGVPVGIICTSWGGTPAEAWTRRGAMEAQADLKPLLDRWDDSVEKYDPEKAKNTHEAAVTRWKDRAAQARAAGKRPPRRPRLHNPVLSQHRPANLYNGMIAPLIPYAIKGAIWYQGESNASRAHQYRTVFPTMINNWRRDWNQGGFSFYWVQLANFRPVSDQPGESSWAELREAQSMTLKLPNTGEAVIIDIGQANDIHPTNKQDVAKRLARWALAKDYSYDIPYASPYFKSMSISGHQVELTFDHVASGLKTHDRQPLKGFAVAGEDKKWHWAVGKVTGKDKIAVWSDAVPKPVAVRYGWAENPVCNLYNAAGLPASPFRTDDWPGITVGKH